MSAKFFIVSNQLKVCQAKKQDWNQIKKIFFSLQLFRRRRRRHESQKDLVLPRAMKIRLELLEFCKRGLEAEQTQTQSQGAILEP